MQSLIVVPTPAESQPYNSTFAELLSMRTTVFKTLNVALAKLDERQHRTLLVGVMACCLQMPEVRLLSTATLTEHLFTLIDSSCCMRELLNIQNAVVYITVLIQGAFN